MMYFFNISALLPYLRTAISWKSSLQKYPTSPTTHPDRILPSQHSHLISPVYFLFRLPLLISSYFLFPEIPVSHFFVLSLYTSLHWDIHSPFFHSMYFAFLFSTLSYTSFSLLLSTLSSAPIPSPQPLPLESFPSFFFSSQTSILSSIYHLETPSLPLSCFIQFFFRPVIFPLFYPLFILFSSNIFRRRRWNFLDFW